MNYLAHAYLSFREPDILAGNLISDFVKGKKKFNYSLPVQQGITLHRSIDTFTDSHEATKKAKLVFKPQYGLYAGAFIDVVYDHFLANDTNEFNKEGLYEFSQWVYATLSKYEPVLPERLKRMFPYMKQQNWLHNYQHRWGIERSFGGIVHRAAYLTESNTAFRLFEKEYKILEECYRQFFPEVKQFALVTLGELRVNSD